MSEASRARRQFVINRREELRWKYGNEQDWPELRGPPDDGANPDPSWGPIGSVARATGDPHSLAHLLALHHDLLQLEQSGRGAADGEPEAMQSDVPTIPAEPAVEPRPAPPPVPRRRRKKAEDPIVDLGGT